MSEDAAGSGCLDQVRASVAGSPPRLGGACLIAIDGPAASGKTSLAALLQDAFAADGTRTVTLHMDDFFEGWNGLNAELEERVLDQVLRPLASGAAARWQQYDWEAGAFDEWHDLPAPEVLILEGCGSGSARYAPYTSVLVWVEAEPELRLARGIARDGEEMRDKWLGWMALELAHFVLNATAWRADLSCRTD